MFLKDKYKADGSFDKTKSRFVVNGNKQDLESVGSTNSPTVNPITVLTLLNVAASKDYYIAAYDIKSAFQKTRTVQAQKDRRIFIKMSGDVASLWLELHPEHEEFLSTKGNIYFELQSFLNGLKEASFEFYLYLHELLVSRGFKRSVADPCLYVKRSEIHGTIYLCVHVDDILCISQYEAGFPIVEQALETKFQLVKQYTNISYLGMSIIHDRNRGIITINQKMIIEKILTSCGITHLSKVPATPAGEDVFEENENEELCPDTDKYLSLVMSLMYLARFTRPDILFAVSYLATKTQAPSTKDMKVLMRVIRYLHGTSQLKMRISKSDLKLHVYADASHIVHHDGKGHSGIILTFGSAPIFFRSVKLKAITRSSTESELMSLEDASTYVVWTQLLLEELGVDQHRPTIVYQDNKSTIHMAQYGGNFKRTKHILCKQMYVRERIEQGDLTLKYCPTDEMVADVLTKPLGKASFLKFRAKLGLV
jgi:hypothetical protein